MAFTAVLCIIFLNALFYITSYEMEVVLYLTCFKVKG